MGQQYPEITTGAAAICLVRLSNVADNLAHSEMHFLFDANGERDQVRDYLIRAFTRFGGECGRMGARPRPGTAARAGAGMIKPRPSSMRGLLKED